MPSLSKPVFGLAPSCSTDILHYSQEPPVGCVRQSRNAPLSWDSVGYAAANPPYKLLIEDGARSEYIDILNSSRILTPEMVESDCRSKETDRRESNSLGQSHPESNKAIVLS